MAKENSTQNTVWSISGRDKSYEHYRTSPEYEDLRNWVDEAYFQNKLAAYLDNDFLHNLRNEDFFGRLWELEVAEWLQLTKLKMIATNGKGPDFCIKLDNGAKIWVEVVLARADEELEQLQRDAIASNGQVYNTPRNQTALRYSSSLVTKADKIKKNYAQYIGEDDYTIIAVSAYAPGAMRSDIDLFMLAVMPIEYQVVHFSTDGKQLDPNIPRPTHTVKTEHAKKTGASVKKEFLYPGEDFPHINGILFSEASNLQQLVGSYSSGFNDETNVPHIFQSYKSKDLPEVFTHTFYFHKFRDNGPMVSLVMEKPSSK